MSAIVRVGVLAVLCLLWGSVAGAAESDFAATTRKIRSEGERRLAEVLKTRNHRLAADVLDQRNAKLKELIAEFETQPFEEHQLVDLEAAGEVYEILLRQAKAADVARYTLIVCKTSSAATLTLMRSLVSLGHLDEARHALAGAAADGLPAATLIQMHALMAKAHEVRKDWPATFEYADKLIHLRLCQLLDDPALARRAVLDFEAVADDVARAGTKTADLRAMVSDYEQILNEALRNLNDRQFDAAVFVRQAVATQLLAEAAIELRREPVGRTLADWLGFLNQALQRDPALAPLILGEVAQVLRHINGKPRQVRSARRAIDGKAELLAALERFQSSVQETEALDPENKFTAQLDNLLDQALKRLARAE